MHATVCNDIICCCILFVDTLLSSVPQLLEYVMVPIRKGLNDPSAYVRKVAVVGCAKIHALSPAIVKGDLEPPRS